MLWDHRRFIDSRSRQDEDVTIVAPAPEVSDIDNALDLTQKPHEDVTSNRIEAEVSMTWNSHNLFGPIASSCSAAQHRMQRPQSACSIGSTVLGDLPERRKMQRPLSACDFSSAGIKAVPDETSARMQRPVSACAVLSTGAQEARGRSRPSSANSMTGRLAAIEANMRHNRERLQANRQGIEAVVKDRQEKARQATDAMAKELERFKQSLAEDHCALAKGGLED